MATRSDDYLSVRQSTRPPRATKKPSPTEPDPSPENKPRRVDADHHQQRTAHDDPHRASRDQQAQRRQEYRAQVTSRQRTFQDERRQARHDRHDTRPARRGPRRLPRTPRRLDRRPGARRRRRAVPGRTGRHRLLEDRACRPDRGHPPVRRAPRRRGRAARRAPQAGQPTRPIAARHRRTRPPTRPSPRRPSGSSTPPTPCPSPTAWPPSGRSSTAWSRPPRDAPGCSSAWDGLRAPLERGTDWDEDRFVEAIRLSGRQPLNMAPAGWEFHQRSRVLAALADLEPIVRGARRRPRRGAR